MDYKQKIIFCSIGAPVVLSGMNNILYDGYNPNMYMNQSYEEKKPSTFGKVLKYGLGAAGLLGAGALYSPETFGAIGRAAGDAANSAGLTDTAIKINDFTNSGEEILKQTHNKIGSAIGKYTDEFKDKPLRERFNSDPNLAKETTFGNWKEKQMQDQVGQTLNAQIDNIIKPLSTSSTSDLRLPTTPNEDMMNNARRAVVTAERNNGITTPTESEKSVNVANNDNDNDKGDSETSYVKSAKKLQDVAMRVGGNSIGNAGKKVARAVNDRLDVSGGNNAGSFKKSTWA